MSGDAQPLPRGRHGIDRDDVRAHQRARIVDATIECVASRGYAETTVGHIVARARVSRETFYALFADKEGCYRESLDATIGDIYAAYEATTANTGLPPAVRLQKGLLGYFQALADRPSLTICFVLERPSERLLTDEERRTHEEIARRYPDIFGGADPVALGAYLAMIDGHVRRYVATDRTAELPDTVEPLMPVIRRMLELD